MGFKKEFIFLFFHSKYLNVLVKVQKGQFERVKFVGNLKRGGERGDRIIHQVGIGLQGMRVPMVKSPGWEWREQTH